LPDGRKADKGRRLCLAPLGIAYWGSVCSDRAMPKSIYILNGPNLNLLGTREPEIYGRESLEDIRTRCEQKAATLGLSVIFRQSNDEGELVGWIQEAGKEGAALILNAGAYSHTSLALADAVQATGLVCVEVHLSNIFARESFRHSSQISRVAKGVICGLGPLGYELAVEAAASTIKAKA
jgi:3-dehydroquinate dehydratase-2